MKKPILLLAMLFVCLHLAAQIHISATDPATWNAQELSQYIGQTVVFDDPIVVSSNVGEHLTVGPWRMYAPECQGFLNTEDYKSAVRINGSCVFRLDGVSEYHRCGEKIYHLTATVNSPLNLTFVSGEWSGNTRAELEAGIPDLGDYRLLVCGFNLENYFSTIGQMGARSAADKEKQRAKVSKALKRINADIIGLVEVQQGNEAVQEIVNDLNTNIPGRNYKYFSDPETGTYQKVEFVYDANKVEPIGNPGTIDTEVKHRKKMVCFREKSTGEKFIYSINHFKAMNTGDEARRVNESKAVVDYYQSYRLNKSVRENDLLLMGDLNCYAFTSPIKTLLSSGLIDLHRAYHADSSYSYMYGGLASYIDHAICNPTLYAQVTGMAAFHINSDENDRYTYDKSNDLTMFRCSDHDPVLVGLKLDSTLIYDPTPQINSANILSGESDQMVIQNAYTPEAKSFYAIYSISGWPIDKHEITSPDYTVELPKQAGVYVVYIYFNGQTYQRKMIVR